MSIRALEEQLLPVQRYTAICVEAIRSVSDSQLRETIKSEPGSEMVGSDRVPQFSWQWIHLSLTLNSQQINQCLLTKHLFSLSSRSDGDFENSKCFSLHERFVFSV